MKYLDGEDNFSSALTYGACLAGAFHKKKKKEKKASRGSSYLLHVQGAE